MNDQGQKNPELIEEISILKQRIKELEHSEAEYKRAEEALRKSEAHYRFVVENANDVIWTFDLSSMTYSYVSPSVERIYGYSVETAMGMTIGDIHPPETRRRVAKAFGKLMAGDIPGGRLVMDAEHYRRNGGTLWMEMSATLLKDNQGKIIGFLGVTRDITARKQAEDALRESEKRYRELTDLLPIAIFEVDTAGSIISFNRTALKVFRYNKEDFKEGMNALQFFPPEEWQRVGENLGKVIQGTSIPGQEYTFLRKNESTFLGLTYASPIIHQDKAVGIRGAIIDITERKQAEGERRKLEERLQRAEKMEALGTLAGGVAHDLNNVLGIVVGYAEMLLDDVGKTSPLRPGLVNIMDGGQRAAAIVQDLLTLARRGVTGRQVLNLNKIIADCQQSPEFEKLYSYHPAVKITTDLDPELLNISGSSVHLGKTLFNLVSNASEAMTKGGLVTIMTANQYLDKPIQGYDQVREGDYVVLSVSDTGEGIPVADLDRIFEPFYTKKVMGRSGTGLGLAVVWGTVKDHNGYINVQSAEGKGSIFTLYFPVTREDITADAVRISVSEYMGSGESILVVDDVQGQRDLAVEMIRKLNYNVESVSSGEEALIYLKAHKVDLVILDMIMDPGMDGLDTYRSILKIHPGQKAIIVSGFSESDRVHAAQAIGVGAYVRKPYVMEKLGLAVRKELDRSIK